jgi:hypothetical protein
MKTVLRYEVPINDQPHTFQLTHNPHAVATKRIGVAPGTNVRVEFWVEYEDLPDIVTAARRTFQVFGTGQPIPSSARLIGATERLDGRVWHLYEVFPDRDGA